MAERLFFFQVNGDTRKVTVPYLDSVSDLVPLLTSKYTDKEISQDPEFWTTDKKFGVRFQISGPEDIYNGAVLEVITREGKPTESSYEESNRSSAGGPNRYNPYPQGPGGFQAGGPGGYQGGPGMFHGEGPGGFRGNGPFPGGFPGGPQSGYGGIGGPEFQETPRPNVQTCATHKKQRTIQNLSQQEDGTWVCNPTSQCKTESSAGAGGEEVCITHGKSRTLPNLEQDDDGNWTCIEGSRCKTSNQMNNRRRGGYGGGYGQFPGGYGGGFFSRGFRGGFRGRRGGGRGRGRGYGRGYGGGYGPRPFRGGRGQFSRNARGRGGGGMVCSAHGKTRTQANMQPNGSGGWVCLPTSQCK